MNQREFIETLQNRASEQKKLSSNIPLSQVFSYVSFWLGDYPWKILIPLSLLFTFALHLIFGKTYYDFILKIFGKL